MTMTEIIGTKTGTTHEITTKEIDHTVEIAHNIIMIIIGDLV